MSIIQPENTSTIIYCVKNYALYLVMVFDVILSCITVQLGSLNCEVPATPKRLGSLKGAITATSLSVMISRGLSLEIDCTLLT